ncbi:MAG: hypothetical protein FGM24_07060 [Candidatus Kapabacteria bacterium]|nr:hypothetical protein [Candidatus Kapabacteria bacterium]
MAQGKGSSMPSKKELEAMKAEMAKELESLPPEQRKQIEALMKSMPAIEKMGQGITDEMLEGDIDRIGVPSLDTKRIAAMAATPSPAQLGSYIKSVHAAVLRMLSNTQRMQYQALTKAMRSVDTSAAELGKTAVGLWLSGRPEIAAAVAGEACVADVGRAENVNNYAAMLTMMNGQHVAVPMLRCLEQQFPDNPTILGNLGQAWYGLGDIATAERYLDTALRRYPRHSQAHMTKAHIDEQRGDKNTAAEHIRESIEAGMSDEKDAELRRIGFVPDDDVEWPLKMNPDPVGLNRYLLPPFPRNTKESEELEEVWRKYHLELDEMLAKIQEKLDRIHAKTREFTQRVAAGDLSRLHSESAGPLGRRARRKLKYLSSGDNDIDAIVSKHVGDAYRVMSENRRIYDSVRTAARDEVEERIKKGTLKCVEGEGSSPSDMECCAEWEAIDSKWLAQSNQAIQDYVETQLRFYRMTFNVKINFVQYGYDADYVEAYNLTALSIYLGTLRATTPVFMNPPCYLKPAKPSRVSLKNLPDYDETHCQYHTHFGSDFMGVNLGLFSIDIDCHLMKTSFNLGKIKGSFTEDLRFADGLIPKKITQGSVDIEISLGKKGISPWGPVKVGASAGVDVHVEFTSEGIQEVRAAAGVNVSVGTDIFGKSTSFIEAVKKGGMVGNDKTILPPGVSDIKTSVGKATGTIVINSSGKISDSFSLKGLRL